MARQPRIHYPGAIYHVMLRGNNGQTTFFSDGDRRHFCCLLGEAASLFDCSIHAFCLMSNHVHLLIQVKEIPLSKFMQRVSSLYTQWLNKKSDRLGHLFQGRYRAFLVETDRYLLELVRYIHLNPVRAYLAKSPEAYLWSGHNNYLGKRGVEWVTTDWILSHFSTDVEVARAEYVDFTQQGLLHGFSLSPVAGLVDSESLTGHYGTHE